MPCFVGLFSGPMVTMRLGEIFGGGSGFVKLSVLPKMRIVSSHTAVVAALWNCRVVQRGGSKSRLQIWGFGDAALGSFWGTSRCLWICVNPADDLRWHAKRGPPPCLARVFSSEPWWPVVKFRYQRLFQVSLFVPDCSLPRTRSI